ncbi:hypothetical protein DICA3_C12948 [Diutina catenulata]
MKQKPESGPKSRRDAIRSTYARFEGNAGIAAWTRATGLEEFLPFANEGFEYVKKRGQKKPRLKCWSCDYSTLPSATNDFDKVTADHLAHNPLCVVSAFTLARRAEHASDEDRVTQRVLLDIPQITEPFSEDAFLWRMSSYQGFPWVGHYGYPQPVQLVRAGLIYGGYDHDSVFCIYCGCVLMDWEQGDDPLVEHEKCREGGCYFLDTIQEMRHMHDDSHREQALWWLSSGSPPQSGVEHHDDDVVIKEEDDIGPTSESLPRRKDASEPTPKPSPSASPRAGSVAPSHLLSSPIDSVGPDKLASEDPVGDGPSEPMDVSANGVAEDEHEHEVGHEEAPANESNEQVDDQDAAKAPADDHDDEPMHEQVELEPPANDDYGDLNNEPPVDLAEAPINDAYDEPTKEPRVSVIKPGSSRSRPFRSRGAPKSSDKSSRPQSKSKRGRAPRSAPKDSNDQYWNKKPDSSLFDELIGAGAPSGPNTANHSSPVKQAPQPGFMSLSSGHIDVGLDYDDYEADYDDSPQKRRLKVPIEASSPIQKPAATPNIPSSPSTIGNAPSSPEEAGFEEPPDVDPLEAEEEEVGSNEPPDVEPLEAEEEEAGSNEPPDVEPLEAEVEEAGSNEPPDVEPLEAEVEEAGSNEPPDVEPLEADKEEAVSNESPDVEPLEAEKDVEPPKPENEGVQETPGEKDEVEVSSPKASDQPTTVVKSPVPSAHSSEDELEQSQSQKSVDSPEVGGKSAMTDKSTPRESVHDASDISEVAEESTNEATPAGRVAEPVVSGNSSIGDIESIEASTQDAEESVDTKEKSQGESEAHPLEVDSGSDSTSDSPPAVRTRRMTRAQRRAMSQEVPNLELKSPIKIKPQKRSKRGRKGKVVDDEPSPSQTRPSLSPSVMSSPRKRIKLARVKPLQEEGDSFVDDYADGNLERMESKVRLAPDKAISPEPERAFTKLKRLRSTFVEDILSAPNPAKAKRRKTVRVSPKKTIFDSSSTEEADESGVFGSLVRSVRKGGDGGKEPTVAETPRATSEDKSPAADESDHDMAEVQAAAVVEPTQVDTQRDVTTESAENNTPNGSAEMATTIPSKRTDDPKTSPTVAEKPLADAPAEKVETQYLPSSPPETTSSRETSFKGSPRRKPRSKRTIVSPKGTVEVADSVTQDQEHQAGLDGMVDEEAEEKNGSVPTQPDSPVMSPSKLQAQVSDHQENPLKEVPGSSGNVSTQVDTQEAEAPTQTEVPRPDSVVPTQVDTPIEEPVPTQVDDSGIHQSTPAVVDLTHDEPSSPESGSERATQPQSPAEVQLASPNSSPESLANDGEHVEPETVKSTEVSYYRETRVEQPDPQPTSFAAGPVPEKIVEIGRYSLGRTEAVIFSSPSKSEREADDFNLLSGNPLFRGQDRDGSVSNDQFAKAVVSPVDALGGKGDDEKVKSSIHEVGDVQEDEATGESDKGSAPVEASSALLSEIHDTATIVDIAMPQVPDEELADEFGALISPVKIDKRADEAVSYFTDHSVGHDQEQESATPRSKDKISNRTVSPSRESRTEALSKARLPSFGPSSPVAASTSSPARAGEYFDEFSEIEIPYESLRPQVSRPAPIVSAKSRSELHHSQAPTSTTKAAQESAAAESKSESLVAAEKTSSSKKPSVVIDAPVSPAAPGEIDSRSSAAAARKDFSSPRRPTELLTRSSLLHSTTPNRPARSVSMSTTKRKERERLRAKYGGKSSTTPNHTKLGTSSPVGFSSLDALGVSTPKPPQVPSSPQKAQGSPRRPVSEVCAVLNNDNDEGWLKQPKETPKKSPEVSSLRFSSSPVKPTGTPARAWTRSSAYVPPPSSPGEPPSITFADKLEGMEKTSEYLRSLTRSGNYLHNDYDSELTHFISGMPENEHEMTISQWIRHMAEESRKTVEQEFEAMQLAYVSQYEDILRQLESLPTKD